MAQPLRVWITGGGTREPMDAVRYVGNYSTGRLSREIAREALRRGHPVTAFLGQGAVQPEAHPALEVVRYSSARDLADAVLEGSREAPDAVVHAAAVADYAPVVESGKVASGRDEWVVRMVPLPKLAPQIRARYPDSRLVIFKLETDLDDAELEARARRTAEKCGADWVFANRLEEVQEGHAGLLLGMRRSARVVVTGREQIAAAILDAVESAPASAGAGGP